MAVEVSKSTRTRAHDAIPRLSGGAPLIGHALELQRAPVGMLLRGWNAHGELFEITALGRRFVAFLGPDAHEAYFRAPDSVLSQREVYQFTVPIFGRRVAYDVSPELMAEQVGFLHPAVHETRLNTYAHQMLLETLSFIEGWEQEGEIDLATAMNELTVNIACRCLLGPEIRAQLYEGFDKLYRDLQGGINLLGFFFPRIPTPAHLRRDHARQAIGKLIGGILKERRLGGFVGEDFIQTLMEARYSDGTPISDQEICGILIVTLFAGHHTSAVLGAWAGLEFALHQDAITNIRSELAKVYGAGARISLATLRAQTTLERAVREAERLHPPLSLLMRKVLRDFDYKGFTIPAGSLAMVSPAAAHRLPAVFPSPDSYNPDRYLRPDGSDRLDPHTMITFGGGKRICIGMHFAYMQVKLIWSVLLSRFDFEIVGRVPDPDYGAWVTGPKGAAMVRYRRRSASEVIL